MNSNRTEYLFSYDTKLEALERSFHQCEHCGGYESKDNRFEANHLLSIWFARETNIPHAIITSIENCSIIHHSCHKKLHKQESREQYAVLAWHLFGIDTHPDYSKDDWRKDPNHPINRKR